MENDAVLKLWTEMADKLVQLAEAVPAANYDRRPTPQVRSCAEQLRHVAFWNDYLDETLRGGHPDGSANELPRATYKTKTAIVDAVRRSFDAVGTTLGERRSALDASQLANVIAFLQHAAEHYGQLVVYARLDDIVPPASRAA